jgi:tetratricopeptide (TPR) repeat protein
MKYHSIFRVALFFLLFISITAATLAQNPCCETQIAEGKKAHGQGQYGEAETIFLKALEQAAGTDLQDQRLVASLNELAQFLSGAPDRYQDSRKKLAEIYYSIGYAKAGKGDREGAIAGYTRAIELDGKNAKFYNSRGFAKASKGDNEGAIADYSKALELEPGALVYANRGSARVNKSDYEGAIADYNRAIELDAANAASYRNKLSAVYLNFGIAKLSKKDYDGAIAAFTSAIDLNPKNIAALNSRGTAKANKKDYDGAIVDFSRSIEIDPKNATAYMNRGISQGNKGDFDAAIKDFTRMIEINPKNAAAVNNSLVMAYTSRAITRIEKGDFSAAAADCTKAIEIDPKFVSAYANRALANYGQGKAKEAQEDIEQVKKLDPQFKLPELAALPTGSPSTYISEGIAKASKGDYQGAITEYNRALTLDSKNPFTFLLRGFAKEHLKDYYSALLDYANANKLDPDNTGKYGYDEMIAQITQLIDSDPKNAHAYSNRGFVKLYKGDYDGSFADFSRAIDIDNKNVIAIIYRGIVEANKSFDNAFKSATYKRAKGYVGDAIRIDPDNPWAHFWRASITKVTGFIGVEGNRGNESNTSTTGESRTATVTAEDTLLAEIRTRNFEMQSDVGKAKRLDSKLAELIEQYPDLINSVIQRAIDKKGLRQPAK